jgi:rubrerythrin
MTAQAQRFTPPFPQARSTRYQCTNCGHLIPKASAAGGPPDRCPHCGAPKEALFLVEED